MLAITTKDSKGNFFFLITNTSNQPNPGTTIDLSALIAGGKGMVWQFDAQHNDQGVGNTTMKQGQMTLSIPAIGAFLV
jgi:hypothetical protein